MIQRRQESCWLLNLASGFWLLALGCSNRRIEPRRALKDTKEEQGKKRKRSKPEVRTKSGQMHNDARTRFPVRATQSQQPAANSQQLSTTPSPWESYKPPAGSKCAST